MATSGNSQTKPEKTKIEYPKMEIAVKDAGLNKSANDMAATAITQKEPEKDKTEEYPIMVIGEGHDGFKYRNYVLNRTFSDQRPPDSSESEFQPEELHTDDRPRYDPDKVLMSI